MTAIENDQGNPEGGKIESNGDDCEQFRIQLSNSFESFDVLYNDHALSSSITDANSLQHNHGVQSSISDTDKTIYQLVDRSTPSPELTAVGSPDEDKCEDLSGPGRYCSGNQRLHDLCCYQ